MSCPSRVSKALKAFNGAPFELGHPGTKELRSSRLKAPQPRPFHSASALFFTSSRRNYNQCSYLGNESPGGTVDDAFLPFTDAKRGMQPPKNAGLQAVSSDLASGSQDPASYTGNNERGDLHRFDCEDLNPQISLLGPVTSRVEQSNDTSKVYDYVRLSDVDMSRVDRGKTFDKRSARFGVRMAEVPQSAQNSTRPKVAREHGYERENWQVQKQALADKFGNAGWAPRKKLSPDALEGVRTLHAQYPDTYTTSVLAQQFEVSPEAIRRILKSRWRPNEAEEESRRQRWERRGESVWSRKAELGIKPPRKWRRKGIGKDQIPLHKRRFRDDGQNQLALEAPSPSGLDAPSRARTKRSLAERIL